MSTTPAERKGVSPDDHAITGHIGYERDGTPYAYYRCRRCERETIDRPPWKTDCPGGSTDD